MYESWQQEELITQEARRGTLMSDWLPASHVRAKVIDFARLSTSRSQPPTALDNLCDRRPAASKAHATSNNVAIN